MEQLWIHARQSFISERLGHVDTKQRLLAPANVARELAAMGLVTIESPTGSAPEKKAQPGVGPGEPLSASPVVPASPAKTPKRPRDSGRS